MFTLNTIHQLARYSSIQGPRALRRQIARQRPGNKGLHILRRHRPRLLPSKCVQCFRGNGLLLIVQEGNEGQHGRHARKQGRLRACVSAIASGQSQCRLKLTPSRDDTLGLRRPVSSRYSAREIGALGSWRASLWSNTRSWPILDVPNHITFRTSMCRFPASGEQRPV